MRSARRRPDTTAAGTILPVVVGGDDVTVICHARFALPLVRAFVLAFEEQTAAAETVRAVTGSGLTAAAGIAYVKPHHPFSAAYALAEELAGSAKRLTRAGSSVDLHVAFESTLADLAGLRRLSAGGLARYGGPYVITAQDSPAAGPRDIAELDRTMRTVSALSSSVAHDLREGLARGPEEFRRRIRRAVQSPGLGGGLDAGDIGHLGPAQPDEEDGAGDGPFVRLLDALLLNAMARPARRHARPGSGDRWCGSAGVSALTPVFTVRVQMLSDWIVGTGEGRVGDVDATVRRDSSGLPFVPAKTLTGIWRDACEQAAGWLGGPGEDGPWQAWVDWVFGSQPDAPGDRNARAHRAPQPAALSVSPARFPLPVRLACRSRPALQAAAVILRPGVAVSDETGVARDDMLRLEERARPGALEAVAEVAAPDGGDLPVAAELLLRAGAAAVDGLGGKRNRGAGRCWILLPGMAGLPAGRATAIAGRPVDARLAELAADTALLDDPDPPPRLDRPGVRLTVPGTMPAMTSAAQWPRRGRAHGALDRAGGSDPGGRPGAGTRQRGAQPGRGARVGAPARDPGAP